MSPSPSLTSSNSAAAQHLSDLYQAALRNLDTNTRITDAGQKIIQAGGGYPSPWTRDAAINTWWAASLIDPQAARDTLLAVCEPHSTTTVIQQDDQWWDQIIWAIAAWHHFVVTGDDDFLAEAYGIVTATLDILDHHHFDAQYGLYRGGAVMQDGISGYPAPPFESGNSSTFVLDYPLAHTIMCLSTNVVYAHAHQVTGWMAAALHKDAKSHADRAATLTSTINRLLWREESGLYGYFLHGAGPYSGTVDPHQETLGHALAILFDIANTERRDRILAALHREPHGVVSVWPHFERFDTTHPGRHNAICWPMIMAFWAGATAHAGRVDLLATAITDLVTLFRGSGNDMYEVYNATTGAVDGGWQLGRHWPSEPDQTWSATTFLGVVHHGLFGLSFQPDGLRIRPALPRGWGPLTLSGLRYRDMTLDITISGAGNTLRSVRFNGNEIHTDSIVIATTMTGHHSIEVDVTTHPRLRPSTTTNPAAVPL